MSDIKYSKLRILIADDFSNFRSTMKAMLSKLGMMQVEMASTGAAVIDYCERNTFDLILCDYDLGSGKSGQQVLEELHHRTLLPKRTIFIIVSADSAKDVVMAAYDCEPDDYLMKPITGKMLQQRISRLLLRREAFTPVHKALDAHDSGRAASLLIDMSIAENRYAVHAQKLLGEMFIEEGELGKAEKLYTRALQTRQLDWARLGLAKVKQLKGELETAGGWLQKIVQDNPLYLPAYDVLASNWEKQGKNQQVQATVQQSVDISPKSILRQKRLANVAENNGDLQAALGALRHTVRLGELSCHASVSDNFNFVRVASSSIEKKVFPAEPLGSEALAVIHQARKRFPLSENQAMRADLLEGRMLALSGDLESAKALIEPAASIDTDSNSASLDVSIECVTALQSVGESDKADILLQKLLQEYAYDQESLERLDSLLAEPVSEANRVMVATLNREGIELYNQERYDDAIDCFEKVGLIFPKHVGVHLNIVQALIGKIRLAPDDDHTQSLTQNALETIKSLIEPGHSQYERFDRLRGMASTAILKPGVLPTGSGS